MHIVLEGIDGSGKATQAELLKEWLIQNTTADVKVVSFPAYDTPVGQLLRNFLKGHWNCQVSPEGLLTGEPFGRINPLVFQALQAANRLECSRDIEDTLMRFGHVVCDRYWQSSVAYGVAEGLDGNYLTKLNSGLPQSDINVLIDVDVVDSFCRRPDRRDDNEKNTKLLERASDAYFKLWNSYHSKDPCGWAVVDGRGSITETHEAIISHVKRSPAWRSSVMG